VTIRKHVTIRTMSLRNSRLCSREEYHAEMLLPRLPPQLQKAPCMHHGASLGQRFAYALRSGNCHAPHSVLPKPSSVHATRSAGNGSPESSSQNLSYRGNWYQAAWNLNPGEFLSPSQKALQANRATLRSTIRRKSGRQVEAPMYESRAS
jgi:hypothetical protein